jgi:16S rRNA (adenine1518-N6/adenine1519-N6)-dimethyltransferase
MESPVLRKGLGQHHLREPSLCRPLIDFLAPAGERTIEIGLGGGVLTVALLAAGARVTAWELDPAWAFAAASRLAGRPLAVVVGDALDLPWERVPAPFKVAGNLPYNVATPLIDRLLDHGGRCVRAAFLVQLEVAARLAAQPGTKAYGALSVLTAARARVQVLGRVRPGSFVPPPKVESAFVGLEPRADAPTAERFAALRELVHAAFGQRRKTLRNALTARWPRSQVAAALAGAGLAPGVRAEELAGEDFDRLLNQLRSV